MKEFLKQHELFPQRRVQAAHIVLAPVGPDIPTTWKYRGSVRVNGLDDYVKLDLRVRRQTYAQELTAD